MAEQSSKARLSMRLIQSRLQRSIQIFSVARSEINLRQQVLSINGSSLAGGIIYFGINQLQSSPAHVVHILAFNIARLLAFARYTKSSNPR